ncbi:hypothetical protein SAMD00023353_4500830 [Rosellinia necatrix]|uniref:Uncharacterized protein n=1 Tax=Rosellinia necatrix TaxID=77044 RepID=A0A1W2TQ09_ROSNE|nr:hypothetical protein SAMD00023353_4500830 [Rosellinia necatrix]
MCVKTYQHFTKCGHVTTTRSSCPTYHQMQQDSPMGLVGRLFRRSVKKTDCGKVVPHHLRNQAYCQACSVKKGNLRADDVGQGALRVRKQGYPEVFLEERKETARAALQTLNSHRRHGQESRHNIIHVETSVWLSDLYYHPETLAKKDAYAREAAAAPPVSSHDKLRSHPRAPGPSFKERIQESQKVKTGRSDDGQEWMPTYGDARPIAKPVRPAPVYQDFSRFPNNTSNLPPAVGPPPGPRHDRSFAARSQTAGRPELRHKTGHISHSIRDPSTQPVTSRPSRVTNTFQVEHAPGATRRDSTNHKPFREKEPRKTNWLGKTREKAVLRPVGSDISFVCLTSQLISGPTSDRPQPKRRKVRFL